VLTGQIQKLDKELSNQKREIAALQRAVTDMQSALVQERKISAKVYAENDKLKIQELENRRKVLALLEMVGQTDQDLVRMLDNEDRVEEGVINLEGDFVPQRIRRYIERIRNEPERLGSLKRTAGCSKLQITALESQLVEQEKCHLQQISQLENERKLGLRDREAERAQFEHRIHDLSQYINKMDETQESILKELEAAKTGQRKAEQKWTSEKETLLRKLQFVQHYGTVLPSRELEGGFFTDKRGEARRTADGKAQRQLQKLNTELAEQKNLMTDYRNQLLRAEAELESIRDQNTANKDVLKHRTKNMIEQVESLRSRYEACETRRKREAEGYQADINILRQKLKHVEQQLIRASLAKAKEHDYIKTIKAYDREIDKLKRRLKNTWQDPDPAPRDPGKDDDY